MLRSIVLTCIFSWALTSASRNGGNDCSTCTLLTAFIGQYAERLGMGGSDAFTAWCELMPKTVEVACKGFKVELEKQYNLDLLTELANECTPDDACQAIDYCRQEPKDDPEQGMWPMCYLYPVKSCPQTNLLSYRKKLARAGHSVEKACQKNQQTQSFCAIYQKTLGKTFFQESVSSDAMYPETDTDGDGFGTSAAQRGWYWNGYDCNDSRRDDLANTTYPGRDPAISEFDTDVDTNCNGISGTNPETGVAYEQELCEGTQQKGLLILGDSASAHFHIPMQVAMPGEWSEDTFRDILTIVANEGDFPMSSWGAGIENVYPDWMNNFKQLDNYPPTGSIYQRLRDHNRCQHNDYQNNGVNGGASDNMQKENTGIMHGMVRDQNTDLPMIVFLALIGNDVCTGHQDTLERMTTPDDFYANTINTLTYLDQRLPAGSHVFISGLADGRILYSNMHDQIHPLGAMHQNVKFRDFYDYMDCLEISPCRGWLQTNETLRDLTTERAQELTQAAKKVVRDFPKWNNFETTFYEFDLARMSKMWLDRGGASVRDIIDPFDGFHPSQVGMSMQAEYMWQDLLEGNEALVGKENPNNDRIIELFGDKQFHGDK